MRSSTPVRGPDLESGHGPDLESQHLWAYISLKRTRLCKVTPVILDGVVSPENQVMNLIRNQVMDLIWRTMMMFCARMKALSPYVLNGACVQGYLAHKKQHPPRTLQEEYGACAQGYIAHKKQRLPRTLQ